MALDVEDYLLGRGGRKMRGSSGWQIELDCPACNKPRHLYAALEKRVRRVGGEDRVTNPGDFICMKCDYRGKFVKLYAELEGIDKKEARMRLFRAGGVREAPVTRVRAPERRIGTLIEKPTATLPTSGKVPEREEPSTEAAIEPTVIPEQEKINTPLPGEFMSCWSGTKWRIPRYLNERQLSRSVLRTFNVGYCDSGPYSGRIILPIDCPEGKSFTSRAISPDEKLRYKAGAGAGRLLFGWTAALLRAGAGVPLVVCEGPFDALSIFQAGFPAVAMMGKRFKAEQVDMIIQFPADTVVMMLDGDALKDAIIQAPELGNRTFIAGALPAKDANDALMYHGADSIRKAVENTRTISEARSELLTSSLAALKAKLS